MSHDARGANITYHAVRGVIVAAKDDLEIQQPRIAQFYQGLVPGCVVEFNPRPKFSEIDVRVTDPKTGQLLFTSSGNWPANQIADMKEGQFEALLLSWRKA